jgi:ribosomal-protein-alanine N-acetyltransferase
MMKLGIQGPGAAQWSQQQYERLFAEEDNQAQSERFAWVAEKEGGKRAAGIPEEKSELLAFLVAHRIDTEWELENLVVDKNARRRGIATLLLGELIAGARALRGSSIFLEVRDSNQRARSLYRKAGFAEAGLRKSYYTGPTEDAIICRLRLY